MNTHHQDRSTRFFAQLTLLHNPKILFFTVLFNWSDTPKVLLPTEASTFSCNTFSRSTRLSIPNCISTGSAAFAQLAAEIPHTL